MVGLKITHYNICFLTILYYFRFSSVIINFCFQDDSQHTYNYILVILLAFLLLLCCCDKYHVDIFSLVHCFTADYYAIVN